MDNPYSKGISWVVSAGVAWLAFKLLRFGRRDETLPPGPPTIPILGNAHLLPRKFPFIRFTEWARQYGGIFSIKVANGTVIVLSDMKSIKELLDERSGEMSSRPALSGLDAVTGGQYFVSAPSASHFWKISRKAIQPLMSPQAVQKYFHVEDAETTQLLYDILHSPEIFDQSFYDHISRTTLSFITSVVYGAPTRRHDAPVATAFWEYIVQMARVFSPEAAPVDFIPALMYVPERWAPWKRLWRQTRTLQRALYFGLLEGAEKRMRSGIKQDTVIAKMMERQEELGLDRENLAYICGVLLDGGSETTASLLKNFVLCLVKCPAAMRKAQKEIDDVVGEKRMPLPSDIDDLPYVRAVIREVQRLRPPAPTAVPHAALNDCEYRGYTIPKGVPIFMNTWGVFHDPDIFERPDEFWPERYLLTADGTKPGLSEDLASVRPTLLFGSGRRLCPGMHLANINSNLAIMRLLWAFDFSPVSDVDQEQPTWDIEREYNDGITFTPKPFQCRITPRGKGKVEVIEECYKRTAITV